MKLPCLKRARTFAIPTCRVQTLNQTEMKTQTIKICGCLLMAASALFSGASTQAGPGDLDTTFNGTGKVITDFAGANDQAGSVALQSDGKIVVAGSSDPGGNSDFALVRYNADGSLDTTFGGTGKVTTDFGGTDGVQSVAIESDGKIVVAGYSSISGNVVFALARYNADGGLDATFGGTGKVTTDVAGGVGRSVAMQNDGKIVVAGDADVGGNAGFAVVCYKADGSL